MTRFSQKYPWFHVTALYLLAAMTTLAVWLGGERFNKAVLTGIVVGFVVAFLIDIGITWIEKYDVF